MLVSHNNMKAPEVLSALALLANPEKAKILQRFFKTGKGQYGEGDQFLGIIVPETRKVAQKFRDLPLPEIEKLLQSQIHEARLCAVFILIKQYDRDPENIFKLYCSNFKNINNWDLVDSSASYIIGRHLYGKKIDLLIKLARSKNFWERRIAIIATLYFIDKGNPEPTLQIAEMLLNDGHDLIHKAVGWMLREVGKRCSREAEENFLRRYAARMPRTMLRYAIERFPEEKRKWYLSQGNLVLQRNKI